MAVLLNLMATSLLGYYLQMKKRKSDVYQVQHIKLLICQTKDCLID